MLMHSSSSCSFSSSCSSSSSLPGSPPPSPHLPLVEHLPTPKFRYIWSQLLLGGKEIIGSIDRTDILQTLIANVQTLTSHLHTSEDLSHESSSRRLIVWHLMHISSLFTSGAFQNHYSNNYYRAFYSSSSSSTTSSTGAAATSTKIDDNSENRKKENKQQYGDDDDDDDDDDYGVPRIDKYSQR
mmetsp:Transcript_12354/g.20500  ORF Transcript_12354/g.20500 Transcript_12354/m.20500 type:complete len:184 (+) Transcript_12354:489-1040(+)